MPQFTQLHESCTVTLHCPCTCAAINSMRSTLQLHVQCLTSGEGGRSSFFLSSIPHRTTHSNRKRLSFFMKQGSRSTSGHRVKRLFNIDLSSVILSFFLSKVSSILVELPSPAPRSYRQPSTRIFFLKRKRHQCLTHTSTLHW